MSDDKKITVEDIKKKANKQDQDKGKSYVELNRLQADFVYWSKMSSWTCHETIFLINGVDPVKALKGDNYSTGLRHGFNPFPTIEKQLAAIVRAKNDGRLDDRNRPVSALYWCYEDVEFDVPSELLLLVDQQREKLDARSELAKRYQAAQESEEASKAKVPEDSEDLARIVVSA